MFVINTINEMQFKPKKGVLLLPGNFPSSSYFVSQLIHLSYKYEDDTHVYLKGYQLLESSLLMIPKL